jgi:hypothetical protein
MPKIDLHAKKSCGRDFPATVPNGLKKPLREPDSAPYSVYGAYQKTLDSRLNPLNPWRFHPCTDKIHDFSMFTGC